MSTHEQPPTRDPEIERDFADFLATEQRIAELRTALREHAPDATHLRWAASISRRGVHAAILTEAGGFTNQPDLESRHFAMLDAIPAAALQQHSLLVNDPWMPFRLDLAAPTL